MKLKDNEKFILKLLLENPTVLNSEISKKLGITPQAVGKAKKQLISKGIIKNQELVLDYQKLGIYVHAIVLIKILPIANKKLNSMEIKKILQPINAIRSYSIPETDITHLIIHAFRNITEYDNYIRKLLKDYGEFVEIKHSYVLSSGSIIKSSSKDLFLDILENFDKNLEVERSTTDNAMQN